MTYNAPYHHINKLELYHGLSYTSSELEKSLRIIVLDICTYEDELKKMPADEDTMALLAGARLWAKATLSRLLISHFSRFPSTMVSYESDESCESNEYVCNNDDCRACCCSCKGY
jgi:hypothetical protein